MVPVVERLEEPAELHTASGVGAILDGVRNSGKRALDALFLKLLLGEIHGRQERPHFEHLLEALPLPGRRRRSRSPVPGSAWSSVPSTWIEAWSRMKLVGDDFANPFAARKSTNHGWSPSGAGGVSGFMGTLS